MNRNWKHDVPLRIIRPKSVITLTIRREPLWPQSPLVRTRKRAAITLIELLVVPYALVLRKMHPRPLSCPRPARGTKRVLDRGHTAGYYSGSYSHIFRVFS